MTKKTEIRLAKKKGLKEKCNEQVKDLIERGVLEEITEKEEQDWTGPVFYITYHEVFKPDSTSTPVRLVINSSIKASVSMMYL